LPSPPLLWRYGCHRGRMTGVMSSQGVVLVPLLTMHDYDHHVDGASTVLGAPWLPILPKGSTCPSGEAEMCYGGSGAFDHATGARARQREVARDAYRARGLSVRLGRDGVCSLHLEWLTCCEHFLGPLRWAYKRDVCYILPPCWEPWVF
jgi:hypothetical protein